MQFAVIETGGKQYLVTVGDKLKLDSLPGAVGAAINFDRVLLIGEGADVRIGRPYVQQRAVEGKILRHGRGKKILVMKYHSKTRYRRKRGHRQPFTEVEITKFV